MNKNYGISHVSGNKISADLAEVVPTASTECATSISPYSFLGTMTSMLLWQAINLDYAGDHADDLVMSDTLLLEVVDEKVRPVFWTDNTLIEDGTMKFDVFDKGSLDLVDGVRIKPLVSKIEDTSRMFWLVPKTESMHDLL